MIKPVLFLLSAITLSLAQKCTEETTLRAIKHPAYNFSVHLLDQVSFETGGHFVYSPISTWLQLVFLAKGAQGNTLKEIFQITGLKGPRYQLCFRKKLTNILNEINEELSIDSERASVIIVDKFFKVNKKFKTEIEALHNFKVLSLDFDKPEQSAQEANDVIEEKTKGNLEAVVLPEDFDKRVLLMTDALYFKSAWKYPFNKALTKPAPFFDFYGVQVGTVDMMNQVGYFKLVELPFLNAKVLELPCLDERLALLVYLPIKTSIVHIYYKLQRTTLTGVLNQLKKEEPKAVNVSLPKFEIETEITNVAELLFDMGVRRAFYPEWAELKGITESGTINVSMMTQSVWIEVTESYVAAQAGPENIIAEKTQEFNVNQPFAFQIVDKKTTMILFAGMYSNPNHL